MVAHTNNKPPKERQDMQSLTETLKNSGFLGFFEPDFSGNFVRFAHGPDTEGKLSGWFQGQTVTTNSGVAYQIARWGSWRDRDQNGDAIIHIWQGWEDTDPNADAIQAEFIKQQESNKILKEELQKQTAKNAQEKWDNCIETGFNKYLNNKKLENSLYGCKLDCDNPQNLIVPLRDPYSNQITSLQTITPEGQKYFMKNGRKLGCFHLIPQKDLTKEVNQIYICEGLATSASVWEAFQGEFPVVCAFDTSNLHPVTTALQRVMPGVKLLLAADNDHKTQGNPGLATAREVSDATGCVVIAPAFPQDCQGTDWNDYYQMHGQEKTREALQDHVSGVYQALLENGDRVRGSGGNSNEEYTSKLFGVFDPPTPMKPKSVMSDNGERKEVKPKHQDIVDAMLRVFGTDILRQGEDIFVYVGTHWKHLNDDELIQIKMMSQFLQRGKLDARNIDAIFKLFKYNLPIPPDGIQMFTPHQTAANFRNGTLHLVQGSDNNYSLKFASHTKEDYLVNVLPYEYNENSTAKNEAFEEMLQTIFSQDEDKDEKIRALGQMFGACLIQAFPRFFLLWGPSGSGKSTAIIIAKKLVHESNWSSVDPTQFHGFNMSSMAGKLVNFDLDINTSRQMNDDLLKKVADRVPMRIQRKNKEDLYAPIPAVHIFGANKLPKSLEGDTGAYARRWTFIKFGSFKAEGNYNQNFPHEVFQKDPEGVLMFAVRGLKDLIANKGHYFVPVSGQNEMREWSTDSDQVEQFLDAVRHGEVRDQNGALVLDQKGDINRTVLYAMFANWCESFSAGGRSMPANEFFNRLKAKGFRHKIVDGYRRFCGLKLP